MGKAFGCSVDVGELLLFFGSVRSREAVPASIFRGTSGAMVGVRGSIDGGGYGHVCVAGGGR